MIQWILSIEDTLGAWEVSLIGRLFFIRRLSDTVEPLNRGRLGSVLYREAILY